MRSGRQAGLRFGLGGTEIDRHSEKVLPECGKTTGKVRRLIERGAALLVRNKIDQMAEELWSQSPHVPAPSPQDTVWQDGFPVASPGSRLLAQTAQTPTEDFSLSPELVHVNAAWADSSCYPPFTVVQPGGQRIGISAFATFQAALVAVAPGGVVLVAPGTYAGGVRIERPVRLVGDVGTGQQPGPGGQAPVIDCSRSPAGPGFVLDEQAQGVTIEGFVIAGVPGVPSVGVSTRALPGFASGTTAWSTSPAGLTLPVPGRATGRSRTTSLWARSPGPTAWRFRSART